MINLRQIISSLLLFYGLAVKGYGQELLPTTSYKYQVTRHVFDRLTYAFANTRPQPRLEIIARNLKKPQIIAQYRPGSQPVVQIDEEVYDLCLKLQSDSLNALAVLLSHELAHHYEKHEWYFTFGISQSYNKIPKESIQQFESEADFYGCFYGELSGFATGRVFPRILDLIYQHFNLANVLEGYPTKENRKAIYAAKQKDAIKMVSVFKAGLFLYLMQEFESAAMCFDYLVNQFPSREIINNLAAAKLQQALWLYTSQEQSSFVYPVELDAQSRLASLRRALPGEVSDKQYVQLLTDARKYAEKSREIDPTYVPAYINLACIYSLQGNQAAAIGVINELKPSNITGNAYSIRAIAYHKDNQLSKAQTDFELAFQKGAYQGKYNLELFNKLNESLAGTLTTWMRSWFAEEESASGFVKSVAKEQIGAPITNTSLPAQASRISISKTPHLVVQWNEQKDYSQLGIQNGTRNYLVHLTQDNYAKQTARKVKRGAHLETLKSKYGDPAYSFSGAKGEYLVYPNNKIAFIIDRSNRVNSWFVYGRIF
ncbi:M48 family metalloprotease [Adhaeribacter pallidiroseus]|uniref:Peptidase M48 domain-containing protein n=1 Tax=Adhaeribacter pallidiroseus TaxID=2072847 RepID=A0A369QGC8_9BACT|nr:hypothetical protein [Adhaeribacter pallidiroseus]RDC61949.1 hypothetical protein AHMF7616_00539 [Adhaeribacter pallidiroseus]